MKSCAGCKYAQWNRTAAGKLHPSGDGVCSFKVSPPELPAAYRWLSDPTPCGGHINRRIELKKRCSMYDATR